MITQVNKTLQCVIKNLDMISVAQGPLTKFLADKGINNKH